ncbi:laminin subunit alpha-2 isoform X2 [Stegastes partitus]|uniref:Basement membrane-specific heparan sulfate proteoglycan core protein n=1 Tax=Stegastes partitus TaxID=144197 RepID=A0A9Y4N0U8_9TELE|nr:PREDICTED: laminin subunit alpha-2 isoform X2 [Stegastes partitus]
MKRLRLVFVTALLWQCCRGQQRGLFPAVLNLATMADISANATCGSAGPEMFCKLVEHVPGQPVRNPQCRTCNQRSTKPFEHHPIEYAIDGTNRWWQSPSIKNGMEYHYVTITLDLKQVFQIAYVIIKAANSPRPGNWILERSIDGVTFEPWQYYAITDTECLTRFNINPRTGPPSYTRDDEVICTSFYSKIHPLENGEIHTSLINGRPSADDPSPTLLNFTSARYIRLVLQRIRTLNADLMTLTLHDPRDIDPIVTRRYYYSIKDISVGGMCICYGHAKACPLNTATKKFSCECEHNTCGESCDRCCPGYHQQPWMAGTFLTRHVCEECNCHGKADECYFNQTAADLSLSLDVHGQYRGGGVCTGCRDNTAGINCQSCVPGYYRPAEVSAEEEDPCTPCHCHPRGSVSQTCVADSSQATPSQPAGSCWCKEGFGGLRCDRCAVGYMGYPSCQRCNCSIEGSTNADPCITPCMCKENVEGENCDRCKLGFYNLQGDNRRGCEKCSCMGVASQCSASTWTYQNESTLTGWHLVGDTGGRVWSVHRETPPYLSVRHLDVVNDLGSAYYWNAPGLYLGNKLAAYGGSVVFIVSYSTDQQEQMAIRVTSEPDIIIEGGGIKIIDKRFGQPVYPSSPSTNHIVLLPENFLVAETAQPISRRDFLSVLANVTRVAVRASYSTETSAVYRLHSFSMQVANPSASGERRAADVEMCSCPPGYAGTSCEACIQGFRRVNGNLYNGVCEPCLCHGHATQCHTITGHCLDCSHNTAGPHCDTCLPGYYGNATHGSPVDCQPCACPLNLPSNNFSPTCHLGEEGELLCDRCQPGYTGPRCDRCSNGYYGQPTLPGGSCQPCDCHDNLDLSVPGSCDPITGQCLRCRQGYGGLACNSCGEGYYGDAITAKNCQPCQCHTNGSVSEDCNKETGQCACRENVVGRQCDECMPNCWWDAEHQECMPCRCSPYGSISRRCDIEGRCICRPGFVGRRCDLRRLGYERRETRRPVERVPMEAVQQRWGGSSRTGGCPRGAYRPKTGTQTHGLATGGVCVPCHCNSFGSKSFDCDETGQCRCQPGVTGPKCDRCSRGFFNFQEGGCTPCQCSHVGNNCDANTGQCICPPNTIGERCDRCAPNHWGHDIVTGCKECGCSVIGSVTQQCNVNTGCCFCRDSFRGEKCNECQIGYRDFPQCTQCECNISGSDSQTCDLERGVCGCADRTGKCSCKVNVEGDNCDRCKPDMFGLAVQNPLGCSKCYCYGLTHSCTEAPGLIRMWLTLKPEQTVLPLVDKSSAVETRRGISFQHPEILAHAELITSTLPEPYYWKLPEQFRGSMITAYGGQLKYAVYYEARDETGPSSYEPQVIVKGGPNRNMVMTRHIPGLQIGQLTRHEIDMTEHEWKHADGRSMTREDFMDILFYVDYILIKASHGNLMRHSRISEISLTVAEEGRPTKESEKAHQIEKCDCPAGYSGLSCEECAAGFYRLRAGSLTSVPASRVPTAAGMGSCVQCQCSGHSSTCDPETSICQNCQDNTEGDQCERCAPGFYGVVRGSVDDCKPCACPLTNPENNFSPTCVSEGFDDYRCTACPEGYEGKYCERCATGYHGNPRMPGGRCEECKCSLWGALPGPCDPVTGQCRCRVGTSGMLCDQCMDRHVCGASGIISCDDECSGLLISDMDRLYRIITDVTLTTPLPPPYKVLYRFENMTEELKHMLSPQKAPERLLQLADSNLGSLVVEMDQLHSRATKVSADGEQVEDDADRIHKRAEDLEQFIRDTLLGAKDLQSKAAELNQTLSRRDGTPDKSLSEMKEEIQAMLAEMRKRQLGGKKGIAEEEKDLAEELYQKVKRMFGDPHQATEDLKAEIKEKLSDHDKKLQEAQDLLNSAQGQTRQAGSLAGQNQANLTALERKRSAVSEVQEEAQKVLGDGERLLEEANQLSDNINKELEDLEEMERELDPLHKQLDGRVTHLTNGLKDGSLADHVHDAEEHAKQLNESAAILDGILAEAKNLSFNATAAFNAYSNIKANVDAAEKEAKAAKQRASEALALALGPEVPVKEAAQDALQKSHVLLNKAKQLQNDVKENADSVAGLKGRVKAARDKSKDLLKAVNGTMATLSAIPNDTAAKLAATKAVAADANATAIDVLERLGDLNLRLGGLQRNYSDLEDTVNAANQMIQDPEKNTIIHAAGAKVKDLEDEADRLLEKLQPIKKLQDNLRHNISQIKELINQARKQANSIKVSVSSGGECLRSYRPDIRKGRYNTIILHVKTTTPDNLLFYLGSAIYVDFLALEMRKGKVNFLWDVGSGVGRVEYPHHTIHDGNWHRIEASRNGLNGTISVYPLEGSMAGMMPTPASANSPTAFTILDVDQNAYLFVGGIFSTVKKADAVRTTTFTGCIGETFLDGKPIGLWNYRDRQGDCKGCVVSPQRSDSEGTVQLDGEGYAAVGRPTRWNPNVSTITFKFRTFSSDALLMYLATEDMKDFMSLELSEGKVKVSFDLGSGAGSAKSANRHNDGRWKSLTMSRNKKQATVTVVDIDSSAEEKISATSQGSATGLNLKENQKLYFGGLPTIGNYRPEVTLKRYAGCLRDIEISRTPYNLLSSSDYTGVTKGCYVENLYTVSFSKPGYMELGGLSLAVGTEISLSFSTLADTGTILLAVGGASPISQQARNTNQLSSKRRRRQSGEPYLSVMLNKGSLEVLVFTGSHSLRRVIRRPDQGTLNDGREHSLRIERLPGRSFAVQVDEEAKREAALPNDQPVSLQRVFLGGIPAEVEQTSNRVNVPFEGCIWNLMVNAILSDFSQPVSFENAEIGRCPYLAPPPPLPPLLPEEEEPEKEKEVLPPLRPPLTPAPITPTSSPPAEATQPAPPAVTPTAPAAVVPPTAKQDPSADLDSCASAVAPTALEKAYQFGLTNNSHMSFAFDDTKVRETLTLEFELRTKEASGLVLYMARINHADFVSIQMKDGLLCLGYDLGRGSIFGCVPFSINDGNWHKIHVKRNKQTGQLTVDGRYKRKLTSPGKADLLDVVGTLYVGGLPQNYTSKRIGPILYSINGCIRNFTMTGAPISTKADATGRSETANVDFKLNMATPSSSHMVGRCFVATEAGTYFDGTGYLKAVPTYRVGMDVSIALEFRTSRTNGVLLAISNQANDGLGLEIVQGKLLFHVDNGAGRITAEHMPEGDGFCDGQWHSITANKLRHRVELLVDGKQSQAKSPNARSHTCDTNDPIYVGGYPDGVRQAALSTNTSFRGCIKNLKITKASKTMDVQFNKALEIKGVQPRSCPAVAA